MSDRELERRAVVRLRGDIAETLALTVGCSQCHAKPGQQCTARGIAVPLAHCVRLNKATADLINKARADG